MHAATSDDRPESITVRKPALADAERLAEIHVAAWSHFFTPLVPAETIAARTIDRRRAEWDARLESIPEGEVVLVAEAGGEPVGFITGSPSVSADKDPAKVFTLGVVLIDPDRSRPGVAMALYAALVEEAASGGFIELEGFVFPDNLRSRRFFRQLGWIVDGHERVVDGVLELRATCTVALARERLAATH